MFENQKNAIYAAEWILDSLEWSKNNVIAELNSLNSSEGDLSDLEVSLKNEYAVRLDAYNAVVLCMKKFVKSADA